MTNTENTYYQDLATLTETGYHTALQITRNIITELEASKKEGDQAIANAIHALKDILSSEKRQEVLLALLGEMSSGKTSLVNAALGYPLFPVAKVTTSACPVEICYGKQFKLQVFTLNQDKESVLFTFEDAAMLKLEDRQALLNYVRKCVTSKILVCENFDYYFDIRKGQADLDNTLHCAQLLIALLNGYVGQDYENVSESRQSLIQERKQLFQDILGFSADTGIGIRIWIASDILKHGLTLVDLPGLGSDTKTHTKITTSYINRAHCCVMLFGLDGNAADNRAALELMQNYEIMRFPGKSNRFILAINKCDDPYEKDPYYYSDAIEQAAQSVYDTLHSIEIREIVPISAWYAEYRYVLNGVLPEKTMLGRRLLHHGKTPEEILQQLENNYTTAFEYTDPHSNQLVSYSTKKFLEEAIGEYSIRIRFLNLARSLSKIAYAYQETLSGLRVETSMIAMLEVLGSDLMGDLMGRMHDALKQTQIAFLNQLETIKEDMDASRKELASMLKDKVIPAYESELAKADKQLNLHMEQEIGKMDSDWAGHFCIDGKDTKSTANKAIFDKLKKYFTTFDFNPYLKPGNTLLKDYLDCQRASYMAGVEKLAGCFQALPAQTDEALDKAFGAFLQSDRLKKELTKDDRGSQIVEEILNIYHKCFNDAKGAITSHLFRLSKSMIANVNSNTLVAKELDTSISHVFSFFNEMISTYHSGCAKYLDSATGTTFFRDRPYLNVNAIRSQISIPFYAEDARKSYVGQLKIDLTGPQAESHNSRMEKALNSAFTSFAQESSQKINDILPIVSDNITVLFDVSADKIRYRYLHIDETIRILDESLDRIETGTVIMQFLDQNQDWAKEATVSTKENIADTRSLLEDVTQEVRSHIPSAISNVPEADESAAEMEQV